MEKKSIYIDEGELIVGERGPEPKATPTYPEICTHSEEDLEILNSREKISFAVNEDTINKGNIDKGIKINPQIDVFKKEASQFKQNKENKVMDS